MRYNLKIEIISQRDEYIVLRSAVRGGFRRGE